MAITTAPSPLRLIGAGRYAFFGYPLPANVQIADMLDDIRTGDKKVVWKVHGSLETFQIDFQYATEDNILAVLAAMRLSC